jgi:hypothetical protein
LAIRSVAAINSKASSRGIPFAGIIRIAVTRPDGAQG